MPWVVLFVVVLVVLFGTFLATLILRTSCGIFGEEQPSYKRAFLMIILITVPVVLCFEIIGYGAARAMHESLKLAPGFSFINWIRLPLGIQWQALGTLPLLKWVPVVISLCVAGIMMVAWIQCTFRKGIMIVFVQWIFNGVALALLGNAGYFALGAFDRMVGLPPDVKEYLTSQHVAHPDAKAKADPKLAPPRDGGKFHNLKTAHQATLPVAGPQSHEPMSVAGPQSHEPMSAPGTQSHEPMSAPNDPAADHKSNPLSTFLHDNPSESLRSWGHSMVEFLDRMRHEADPLIDTIRNHSHPVTQHFPIFINNFLDNQGGWLIIIGSTVTICFLWLKRTVKRFRKVTKKKRRKASDTWNMDLAWHMGDLGDVVHPVEGVQLTVKGMPARLRAVVLSSGTKETQPITDRSIDGILDFIQEGMSKTLLQDQPLVRIWEPAYGGSKAFANLCQNLVTIPGPKGKSTNWVIVAGTVEFNATEKVHIGLAFQTEKATTLRNLTVDGQTTKWQDAIGTTEIMMLQRA